MADDLEEQYLLRVQDRALAARLTRVLQEDAAAAPADADINLEFAGALLPWQCFGVLLVHILLFNCDIGTSIHRCPLNTDTYWCCCALQRRGTQGRSQWAARPSPCTC